MRHLKLWTLLAFLAFAGNARAVEINDLNVTDASNTARFPENMAPSAVNDGARASEGQLARWHKDTNALVVSTGSANAYAVTANQTLTAYYDGLVIAFDANFANAGSATLNVDGFGAKTTTKRNGRDTIAGDIQVSQEVLVVYDGTNFEMRSPIGANDTLNVKDYGATGDGVADDTTKIQSAIDAAETANSPLFFPQGTYLISAPLKFKGTGRVVYGAGRDKTIIKASAGGFSLVLWGDPAVDKMGYCQRGALRDLSIQGHASSTGGLIVGGPTEDNATWSTASRGNEFTNLLIFDIGNGPALRNSAWVNTYRNVELWDSDEGLVIGAQSNAVSFYGLYVSRNTGSALRTTAALEAAITSSGAISFYGSVFQHSGVSAGRAGMIDIRGGHTWLFNGTFMEELETTGGGTATAWVYVANSADLTMRSTFANPTGNETALPFLRTNGAIRVVLDALDVQGDVDSFVEVDGATDSVRLFDVSINGKLGTGAVVDDSTNEDIVQIHVGGGSGRLEMRWPGGNLRPKTVTPERLVMEPGTDLTIATGAVTITHSNHRIETEAAASTDDLDTISGGTTDQILVLAAVDSSHTVVCKDGTGNLALDGDFSLTNRQDRIMLIYDGSYWNELSRSNNTP